jgi:hypothetical protein
MRRVECQGCGKRFTTTERFLGAVAVVARNSSQIREPISAVGFVCACLDRADNPGLIVQFIGVLMSAAALRRLRGHMVSQVAQVRDGARAEAAAVTDSTQLSPCS